MKAIWTRLDSDMAQAEGWDVFHTAGGDYLLRLDETEEFYTDAAAWKHVFAQATGGSGLHVKALRAVSPDELVRMVATGFLSMRLACRLLGLSMDEFQSNYFGRIVL